MKKKSFIALLTFICAICCALGLAACNGVVNAESVTLNKTELKLNVGHSEMLTATILPEKANNNELFWSVEDNNIASVDENGTVTALSRGTTTVTATVNAVHATCTVTVEVPVQNITLNEKKVILLGGTEETISATLYPADANCEVVWTVEPEGIAAVENGKITALSQGEATVTASAGDLGDSCTVIVTEDGINYILNEDGESYKAEYNYPNQWELFDREGFTSVEIASEYNGKPVTKIGGYAFAGLYDLQTIQVPASVTEIELNYDIMSRCEKLESIIVDAENQSYSSVDGVLYNKSGSESIFVPYGKTGIVTIPEAMTKIGARMFEKRKKITGVKMHDGVTAIGEYAFCDCIGINSFTIPENMTEIGQDAFAGCIKLWEVYNFSRLYISLDVDPWTAPFGDIGYYALNVLYSKNDPSGIDVTDSGFTFYTARDKVYLVDYTGNEAELALPLDYKGKPYDIAHYAFYRCKSITSVRIPEAVTKIGVDAFADCENLANVEIGDGVQKIESDAFYNCSSLVSIIIPDGVTELEGSAFRFCNRLTNVVLGTGITAINFSLFEYCSSLEEVTIMGELENIDSWSFGNCESLKKIHFNGTVEQWNAVRKSDSWDLKTTGYTVYCTNGDVTKGNN